VDLEDRDNLMLNFYEGDECDFEDPGTNYVHIFPYFFLSFLGFFQCCGSGSGIRCLFDPWIWDPGWVESQHPNPGSGMNNPDHIF
jgi:hypothetical protein